MVGAGGVDAVLIGDNLPEFGTNLRVGRQRRQSAGLAKERGRAAAIGTVVGWGCGNDDWASRAGLCGRGTWLPHYVTRGNQCIK